MELCEVVDKYSEPMSVDNVAERKAAIERKLEALEGCDGIEKEAYLALEEKLIELTYPKISLRFLEHSDVVSFEAGQFSLPHFGVFQLAHSDFSIRVRARQTGEMFDKRQKMISFGRLMSPAITEPLVRAIDSSEESWEYFHGDARWTSANSCRKRHLPSIFPRNATQSRHFVYEVSMIVPSETKKEMEVAKRFFTENELYIITELDPEKWQSRVLPTADPLVIGVWRNKTAFLITKFDPMPLEDYVSREFIVDEKGED